MVVNQLKGAKNDLHLISGLAIAKIAIKRLEVYKLACQNPDLHACAFSTKGKFAADF